MEMHFSEMRLKPDQMVSDRFQLSTQCKPLWKASSVALCYESKQDSCHQRVASIIPTQSIKIPESCEIFNPPQESCEIYSAGNNSQQILIRKPQVLDP